MLHSEAVKHRREQEQLLFSCLPSHVKSGINTGIKLHTEETNELARKTGWEIWKVLSIWMRLTGRE